LRLRLQTTVGIELYPEAYSFIALHLKIQKMVV